MLDKEFLDWLDKYRYNKGRIVNYICELARKSAQFRQILKDELENGDFATNSKAGAILYEKLAILKTTRNLKPAIERMQYEFTKNLDSQIENKMRAKERKYYALIDAYKQNWSYENIESKIEKGILTIKGCRSDFEYWYSIHLIDRELYWRVVERFYEDWGYDDLRVIFCFEDKDYGLLDPCARWSSEKKDRKRILVAKYNACDDGVQFIQHIRRIRELLEIDDDYFDWIEAVYG